MYTCVNMFSTLHNINVYSNSFLIVHVQSSADAWEGAGPSCDVKNSSKPKGLKGPWNRTRLLSSVTKIKLGKSCVAVQ